MANGFPFELTIINAVERLQTDLVDLKLKMREKSNLVNSEHVRLFQINIREFMHSKAVDDIVDWCRDHHIYEDAVLNDRDAFIQQVTLHDLQPMSHLFHIQLIQYALQHYRERANTIQQCDVLREQKYALMKAHYNDMKAQVEPTMCRNTVLEKRLTQGQTILKNSAEYIRVAQNNMKKRRKQVEGLLEHIEVYEQKKRVARRAIGSLERSQLTEHQMENVEAIKQIAMEDVINEDELKIIDMDIGMDTPKFDAY